MAGRYRGLPAVVYLTRQETVNVAELSICLGGASRSLRHLWRREKGFPQSYKDGRERVVITAALQSWLEKQGCEVKRV